MISCKEAVEILNKNENLSAFDKTKLELHLKICQCCESYLKHLESIKKSVSKLISKISTVDDHQVKELEDKVLKKIINR